ncbi:glycosyltransferase family 4 protein [Mycolicibacterium rufum]|uniref:Glycosyltransferase family 4 protein n=1 Tax=Mycolicibacterium rufum TaxID=318424 RepID=A0A9X2YHM1_9MYCO|nr:glycosyltransferase family 1 protein [Mycolicibacterium rufum]KGI67291.1 glycosyl transferase family 1 [Mycolicibacterium rufum]MCV7073490.1 glycosyltransferase family 4 protein [Mycolicibacterium rufum]ULP38202.1 glycosyltransferase family 4 protein [Mycolicibacterium rufum]
MTDRRVDLLFDARHIRQSGIGTYIATLLPSLEETFVKRGLSLAVLANEGAVPEVQHATVVTAAPAVMYTVGEQRVWAHALSTARPRGFWVPHYPFPFAALRHRGMKLFTTVHDTMHVRPAEISGQSTARRAYARTMFRLDGRFADLVFTPSEATATTLRALSPRARTMVTPIPVDEEWFAPVDPALSPVSGPYVLYVGNAKWHKNLPLLLTAFGDVAGEVPHRLVIAGSGEALRGGDERVPALAAALGDRVQVMGRLDFAVLRALVAGADLLVMPSLHEGAGLPPIEAMASHTAVLASDIPALRETCGDGADYFDPTDRAGLAALLRALCRDEDARAKLAARGWAHVTARQAGLSLAPAAEAVAEMVRLGS